MVINLKLGNYRHATESRNVFWQLFKTEEGDGGCSSAPIVVGKKFILIICQLFINMYIMNINMFISMYIICICKVLCKWAFIKRRVKLSSIEKQYACTSPEKLFGTPVIYIDKVKW